MAVLIQLGNRRGEQALYGPYSDEFEAEQALKRNGWKERDEGYWIQMVGDEEVDATIESLSSSKNFATAALDIASATEHRAKH